MATKSVFISRAVSADSPFAVRLRDAGWQVEGRSLVELAPVAFRDIPPADHLFFTSRNAVRFFFDAAPHAAACSVNWAALGPATAQALARYVEKIDFTGTGDPATTAAAFKARYADRMGDTILFPAARHSRQSLIDLLSADFTCLHLTVYDNRPVGDAPFSPADALVFTSPMNAQAYFARHALRTGQRLVAIGRTTAETLAALGFTDINTATEATEAALAEAVLRLPE